jgi:uncharacterized protein
MKFYAPEKISRHRTLTPEGFLLIEGTPISRIGVQEYGEHELNYRITGDQYGIISVERDPEDVFDIRSIASFNGKPLVDDHPEKLVTPDSWAKLSRGIIMNPRRGEGAESDLLIADIMVHHQDAIDAIMSGKTDLSCGYNADYIDLGGGRAKQRNILGNHVALVEVGRCGSRCAIGDHHDHHRSSSMPKKVTIGDKLMRVLGVSDQKALEARLAEESELTTDGGENDNATHLHVHMPNGGEKTKDDAMTNDEMPKWFKDFAATSDARFSKIEKALASKDEEEEKKDDDDDDKEKKEVKDKKVKDEEAEEEKEKKELEEEAPTGDAAAARVAKDSAYLVDAWQASVAMAEIIAPGFASPSMDRAARPRVTLDALCGFRRRVLDIAHLTGDGRMIIDELMNGRPFDSTKLSCDQARQLFLATAAAKRRANNAGGSVSRDHSRESTGGRITSIADLQKRAEELYKPQNARAKR